MIASRKFHAICTHKVPHPQSESTDLPPTRPTTAGESVYIHTTALPRFVAEYLPHVSVPFVLVSGDSDMTVPDDYPNAWEAIVASPLVRRWYAQNCTRTDHPKVVQLPIGLYFHTVIRGPHPWSTRLSPAQQEAQLYQVCAVPRTQQTKCYGNFHFLLTTRYGHDRHDAMARIPRAMIDYEPRRTSRLHTWTTMRGYRYIVSPHGNGLDCHRTWEALALGCIPIVKSSPLDPMYAGLPVLIVRDWNEVTQERLTSFVPDRSALHKLTLTHWNNQINDHTSH
jgi:hypothetical protein